MNYNYNIEQLPSQTDYVIGMPLDLTGIKVYQYEEPPAPPEPSQIIFGDNIIMDLTNDTIVPEAVLSGYTFHAANGRSLIGSLEPVTPSPGLYIHVSPLRVTPDIIEYNTTSTAAVNFSKMFADNPPNYDTPSNAVIPTNIYINTTNAKTDNMFFGIDMENTFVYNKTVNILLNGDKHNYINMFYGVDFSSRIENSNIICYSNNCDFSRMFNGLGGRETNGVNEQAYSYISNIILSGNQGNYSNFLSFYNCDSANHIDNQIIELDIGNIYLHGTTGFNLSNLIHMAGSEGGNTLGVQNLYVYGSATMNYFAMLYLRDNKTAYGRSINVYFSQNQYNTRKQNMLHILNPYNGNSPYINMRINLFANTFTAFDTWNLVFGKGKLTWISGGDHMKYNSLYNIYLYNNYYDPA